MHCLADRSPYTYRDEDNDTIQAPRPPALFRVHGRGASPSDLPTTRGADTCNDRDPSVFASHTVYPDLPDGDGFGVAPRLSVCTTEASP